MSESILHRLKKFFIPILLALITIYILAACSYTKEVNWDNRFIERFQPTEDAMAQTRIGIHNVNIDAVRDDLTLYIGQTLGDGKTIYIALDAIFSNAIDVNSVEVESVNFYKGKVTYGDIKGKKADEIIGGISVEQQLDAVVNNCIPYIISFISNDGYFLEKELTMAIQITAQNNFKQDVMNESFVISWIPKNRGQAYDLPLNNTDGKLVGDAFISAFYFEADLFYSGYETFEELAESVRITMNDGTIFNPKSSMAGSYSSTQGGFHKIRWQFREILILSEVKSLQIGDYKVDIKIKNFKIDISSNTDRN
ncbi:MAG: hypothetical protein FWF85_09450 [Clostridiales bacterium]|nr:hypothetical protein [Clostridiales bacterium]